MCYKNCNFKARILYNNKWCVTGHGKKKIKTKSKGNFSRETTTARKSKIFLFSLPSVKLLSNKNEAFFFKKKEQIKIPEIEIIAGEMKNTFDGYVRRLENLNLKKGQWEWLKSKKKN